MSADSGPVHAEPSELLPDPQSLEWHLNTLRAPTQIVHEKFPVASTGEYDNLFAMWQLRFHLADNAVRPCFSSLDTHSVQRLLIGRDYCVRMNKTVLRRKNEPRCTACFNIAPSLLEPRRRIERCGPYLRTCLLSNTRNKVTALGCGNHGGLSDGQIPQSSVASLAGNNVTDSPSWIGYVTASPGNQMHMAVHDGLTTRQNLSPCCSFLCGFASHRFDAGEGFSLAEVPKRPQCGYLCAAGARSATLPVEDRLIRHSEEPAKVHRLLTIPKIQIQRFQTFDL